MKFCVDATGVVVECATPPAIDLVDADLPAGVAVFSEAARTTTYPEGEVVSDYEAHVVLHQHVWDPSLSDPDA